MFSDDYLTARARFCAAAERLGWTGESCPVGASGPRGEPLSIDVAYSAAAGAERVLLLSSGLHGVEGFLGSAIQLALLDRWRRPPGLPQGVRCVMVHALNPYGFAWSRRCDADNIDLNRNFIRAGIDRRTTVAAYSRLDGFLNPRRPPSRCDLFYPLACWMLARHGRAMLKEAIAAGQYDFPAGLFFGGQAPSRTQQILQQHMRSWVGRAGSVFHLDFHSGLGRRGSYRLLADEAPTAAQRDWRLRTFGPGVCADNDPQGLAYPAAGTFGRWCAAQHFAADYLFAFAEFGTYGNLRVLAGLRAENQAHHWGRPQDRATLRAKMKLRELFCPASAEWRAQALAQGVNLVERALRGQREGA